MSYKFLSCLQLAIEQGRDPSVARGAHVDHSRDAQKAWNMGYQNPTPTHTAGVRRPVRDAGYLRHDYHTEV